MSQETAIGWTDLSWNPVHGCSIVCDGVQELLRRDAQRPVRA